MTPLLPLKTVMIDSDLELLDRDGSILAFNERVLDWAKRPEVPLLERLRYLCIVSSNLDEFFEVLTWAQLGLHSRPFIVANIEGYWQPMLTMVDHVIASGFADASLRSLFCVTHTVDEIETLLRSALNTANQ